MDQSTEILVKPKSHPKHGYKYLFYSSEITFPAGLSDKRASLASLLAEAEITKRIPIVPNFVLDPKHNHGFELPPNNLLKYISLERFRSVFPEIITLDEFDFAAASRKLINQQTNTLELAGLADVLVERVWPNSIWYRANPEIIDRISTFHGTGSGSTSGWFLPTQKVRELAAPVLSVLGEDFVGVHLRRGDRMEQIPAMKRDTSPSRVMQRVREFVPNPITIYLSTNETSPKYLNEIKEYGQVVSAASFESLKIDELRNDNYLLFAVEMYIVGMAKEAFYTFCDSRPWYYSEKPQLYRSLLPYSQHKQESKWKRVIRKLF